MAVLQHVLALLIALAPAPQEAPAAAEGARVVGHVRINGASRFADRAAALYGALGMGERLLTRQRVLDLLGRGFPAPDLAGVAGRGAFGLLLIDDGSARLRGAPFSEIADRRSFLASVEALSGLCWQAEPDRLAPAHGAAAGAAERGGERFVAECDGGMLFLPAFALVEPARAYARAQRLFDVSDAAADVSLRLALADLRPRGASRAAALEQALGAAALALRLLGRDSAEPVARAARGVGSAWKLASQWDDLAVEISLDQDAVRVQGFLVALPDSRAAQWLGSARRLPAGPLPGRPEEAVLALECSGDGALLAQLIAHCAGLEEGDEVIDLLKRSSGDVGFYVVPGFSSPGLCVIASCPEPEGLGEQAGEAWAVGQAAGWSVVATGEGAREAVAAALDRMAGVAVSSENGAAPGAALRAEVSLTGLLGMIWPGVAQPEEGAPGPFVGALLLECIAGPGELRFELELPVSHLAECVPELRIR
ncbi:MAG: hypothetical protein HY812_13945 [Planctomycetes bacterium]|nr:hypothetical protein [Planctomycetota bacterium]